MVVPTKNPSFACRSHDFCNSIRTCGLIPGGLWVFCGNQMCHERVCIHIVVGLLVLVSLG